MKKSLKILFFLLFIAPLLMISCNQQDDNAIDLGKGRVAIHITDAPFPASLVEHAFVTIDRIGLRYKDGECKAYKGEDKEEFECMDGFLVLMETPVTIDLMELRNGLTDLLFDSEIPVGTYDMVRLYVEDAEIVISESISFKLKVPGGSTGGLKVFLNEPVVVTPEGISEILLDFDLSRSFVAQGNTNSKKGIKGFIFKPVVRAADYRTSGVVTGKVTDMEGAPIEEVLVSLLNGEEVVTTALTNEAGVFKIVGIPNGTYTLLIEKEGYKAVEITNVMVTKKPVVNKDIKLETE